MTLKHSKVDRLAAKTRYRVEDGKVCIELKLMTYKQLFDFRDPAPFRDRDLDDDAVQYIVACAQEFPPGTPLKLVMHFSDPQAEVLEDSAIRDAVHSFFDYESELLRKQLRKFLKSGRAFLLVGLSALTICLVLARLTETIGSTQLRSILREGLVISGWVAMWRPVELFLYDWRPLREKRKYYDYLKGVEIEFVHTGKRG